MDNEGMSLVLQLFGHKPKAGSHHHFCVDKSDGLIKQC